MKTEAILAALLEIQEQSVCYSSILAETQLTQVKASVDTLVAMLKKELEGK